MRAMQTTAAAVGLTLLGLSHLSQAADAKKINGDSLRALTNASPGKRAFRGAVGRQVDACLQEAEGAATAGNYTYKCFVTNPGFDAQDYIAALIKVLEAHDVIATNATEGVVGGPPVLAIQLFWGQL